MKIAVTSTGTSWDSPLDPRFGRARYILVVDSEEDTFEVMDNEKNRQSFKGAGIQAATSVIDSGVNVLLTGYCGPNAFKALTAGEVKVVQDVTGTVRGAVESFHGGELAFSETPNTEGHW